MSAREELIEIVTRDPISSGGDETWATDLVDAFVHELAEKIRALRPEAPEGFTLAESYRLGWDESRRAAADLIDPAINGD